VTELIEISKLILSSIVGGIIGGWLSFRLFIAQKRYETKHQDEIVKRDALRDMLAVLPVVIRDIHLNWEMPEDSKETSKEHIANMVEKITRWRALFLNDPEMLAVIQKLNLLIGASKENFLDVAMRT
jgi:hypothetical protein